MGQIIQGDALAVLRNLPDHSVDSIVTDPPYALTSGNSSKGFMGKDWDNGAVAFSVDLWREARRVLKPGGHVLAFGGSRTYHKLACAIEDAGLEIRDQLMWLYGEGMPKSHDISRAIDRMANAERAVIGVYDSRGKYDVHKRGKKGTSNAIFTGKNYGEVPVTVPATSAAQTWQGWGSGLKPAHEPICLARAPLAEDTIAAQVLATGTGAINIDASRVGSESTLRPNGSPAIWSKSGDMATDTGGSASGRWPANLLLSHNPECTPDQCVPSCPVVLIDQQSGHSKSSQQIKARAGSAKFNGRYNGGEIYNNVVDTIGGHNDQGGASRYFAQFYYCPKASKRERNAGCEGLPEKNNFDKNTSKQIAHINHNTGNVTYNEYHPSVSSNNHPTVKPIKLMQYLVRLITPPGGICLDMFAGSGTTALACIAEGFDYILIEQNSEYVEIARARAAYAERQAAEVA